MRFMLQDRLKSTNLRFALHNRWWSEGSTCCWFHCSNSLTKTNDKRNKTSAAWQCDSWFTTLARSASTLLTKSSSRCFPIPSHCRRKQERARIAPHGLIELKCDLFKGFQFAFWRAIVLILQLVDSWCTSFSTFVLLLLAYIYHLLLLLY